MRTPAGRRWQMLGDRPSPGGAGGFSKPEPGFRSWSETQTRRCWGMGLHLCPSPREQGPSRGSGTQWVHSVQPTVLTLVTTGDTSRGGLQGTVKSLRAAQRRGRGRPALSSCVTADLSAHPTVMPAWGLAHGIQHGAGREAHPGVCKRLFGSV